MRGRADIGQPVMLPAIAGQPLGRLDRPVRIDYGGTLDRADHRLAQPQLGGEGEGPIGVVAAGMGTVADRVVR